MSKGWLQYIDINSAADIRIVVRRQSALREVSSLFQSHYSLTCGLVFPLSIFGSCLLLLLSVTSILPSNFPSSASFIRQFLRKMWPIRLASLHFVSCTTFRSTLTLVKLYSSHDRTNWFSISFSFKIFKNFPRIHFPKCPLFSTPQM